MPRKSSASPDPVSTVPDRPDGPMRVLETSVYRGPHLFGPTPMIRFRLDLGALEAWPTSALGDFGQRLGTLMPSLAVHACSRGHRGGFLERLEEGTWMGHVVEHVAIELQVLSDCAVARGKTRAVKDHPGLYDVLFEYEEEAVGLLAARRALELVAGLIGEVGPPAPLGRIEGLERLSRTPPPGPFSLEAVLQELKTLRERAGLGPTTRAIVREARRRGIPVMRLDDASLVQLGWGAGQKRIRASITGSTPFIGVDIASDKNCTKSLLTRGGVPTPQGGVALSREEAVKIAASLGGPVVVKPLDANHGRGVTTNISSPQDVTAAYERARTHGRRVVVERFLPGRDHRCLVIGGRLVAAAERIPAHVVGDGESRILDLIEVVNSDPRRGTGHAKPLTRIQLDAAALEILKAQGHDPESRPAEGEIVFLRQTANLSTGGTAVDRTDDVHPENAAVAIRAARMLGLDIAGIDLVTPDISRPLSETGGGVVEVNAAPGFRMHLEPTVGRPRPVARAVMDMMFPKARKARIPVFAVTGTNGKSTTARMLAHILRHSGLNVGLTTTSGVYVNDDLIMKADASGPRSARMVLSDPGVEAAVFEVARGGLLREGLAFDSCDAACVTNIQPDHLGLKGIRTVQDLAWVKSVVVENVSRRGVSVLNADDVLVARMRRRAGGRICFFSLRGGPDMPGFLADHIADGGMALVREPSGDLVLHRDGARERLMNAAQIPACLGGLAEFNVQNALAAAAMAIGADVPTRTVREALAGFGLAFEQNPGRLNIHDAHGFRIIMDYAHNAAGLMALRSLLVRLKPKHGRLIGMVTVPGDRRDEDIREMGEVGALTFDELVLREDPGRRGRAEGEIIALLREGALRAGIAASRIHEIPDEIEAAAACMTLARPGDLVVLTPTEVEAMWRFIKDFRPNRRPEEAPPVWPAPLERLEQPAVLQAGFAQQGAAHV